MRFRLFGCHVLPRFEPDVAVLGLSWLRRGEDEDSRRRPEVTLYLPFVNVTVQVPAADVFCTHPSHDEPPFPEDPPLCPECNGTFWRHRTFRQVLAEIAAEELDRAAQELLLARAKTASAVRSLARLCGLDAAAGCGQ